MSTRQASIFLTVLSSILVLNLTGISCVAQNRADLIWVDEYSGCDGDTIEAVIMISNTDTVVEAINFQLGFDDEMLDYVSCDKGTLDPGWFWFDCQEDPEGLADQVRVIGVAVGGSIPAGSTGSIARLTFSVNCPGCENNDSSILDLNRLLDHLELFTPTDGTFTYICPTPTPEPTATPAPQGNLLGVISCERPGTSPPHDSWIVDLSVTLCDGGVEVGSYTTTTDSSGRFLAEVLAGDFDVLVKGNTTLASRLDGINIPENDTTELLDFGTLAEGDADNDNTVLSVDFFIMRNTYNLQEGDPGYDDRADFNRNASVTSTDFFLLRGHYNQAGPECN